MLNTKVVTKQLNKMYGLLTILSMHYYLIIGCVSAHGKQGKRCNTIVAVKRGSTFGKPIVNNPIPIFVDVKSE